MIYRSGKFNFVDVIADHVLSPEYFPFWLSSSYARFLTERTLGMQKSMASKKISKSQIVNMIVVWSSTMRHTLPG